MQSSSWIAAYRRKPGCVARHKTLSILYYQTLLEIKALQAFDLSDYLCINLQSGTIRFSIGHSNKNMHHGAGLTGALRIVGRTRCYWRLLMLRRSPGQLETSINRRRCYATRYDHACNLLTAS